MPLFSQWLSFTDGQKIISGKRAFVSDAWREAVTIFALDKFVERMAFYYIDPTFNVGVEDMVKESTPHAVDRSLVARIVRSYVAQNTIGIDQLAGLISTVHRSLSGLDRSAPVPGPLVPAVSIGRSVQLVPRQSRKPADRQMFPMRVRN